MAKYQKTSITYPGYAHIPKIVLEHQDFICLSAKGVKLLLDLLCQYNGRNNGDLCCAMSLMSKRGWNSNASLAKAKRELVDRGFIQKTRAGGLHMGADLYAVTWQPINECKGKLEVSSTTNAPRKW